MDLDDIRLKEPEELTNDEKKFLSENKNDLTDEEKEVFASALKPSESKEPEKPEFNLTEEEFQKRVDDRVQQVLEERKKAREEAKRPKDDTQITSDWKPKDWKEAFDTLDRVLSKKYVGKEEVPQVIQQYSETQRKKIEEHQKMFDEQTEEMKAKYPDLVPDKGTPERETFDANVAEIAIKYGTTSLKGAIEVYKLTHGKGSVDEKQSDLAHKIGKGGSGEAPKVERKYSERPRNLDDAAARALERLEKES